jgi:Nicotinic acid phosphoribosyltransferase
MIDYSPLLCLDFYKTSHAEQYPKGLTKMVSYYTPRMSRLSDTDKLTMFGLQAFIGEYLIDAFNDYFFEQDVAQVINEYNRLLGATIGTKGVGEDRLRALHKLGYLPIKIRALPEGVRSNIKIPQIEISNTVPEFVWLVNSIETMLSCTMWHTQLSAEVGYRYRQIINKYADLTCDDSVVRAKLLGDFSMRGQESVESATKSSAAFCLSFLNTATVPAILWLEKHYGCNAKTEPVAFGALSTEHSVMCSNLSVDGDERTHLKRLLTEIYPNSSFSVVSDSYDYWNLVENILPTLKEEIIAHNGCISIRGDSGDPVQIVTKTVYKLWDIFGGTVNSKGYKVLDPHIKAIYGDSITPQRCESIYDALMKSGFAISNVALGVGSFSLQCLEMEDGQLSPFTRDTFGIAVKATYAEDADGSPIMIYKDPKTDDGNFKKSQRGCCRVIEKDGEFSFEDGLTWAEVQDNNCLLTVFEDGRFVQRFTLSEIRNYLHHGNF